MKPYIILISILFIYTCEELPPYDLANSYEDIHVTGPAIINSYDDRSIAINLFDSGTYADSGDVFADVEKIHIDRFSSFTQQSPWSDTTAYSIPFIIDAIIIDSIDIELDNYYYYEFQFESEGGLSKHILSDSGIFHHFPGIDSLQLTLLTTNSAELSWQYPYSNYFSRDDLENLTFNIIESKRSLEDSIFIQTEVNIDFEIDYQNWNFTYDIDVDIGDSVYYEISAISPYNQTDTQKTDTLDIHFPSPEWDWIPLNSKEVYLYWRFDPEEEHLIDEVYLKNQIYHSDLILVDKNGSFRDSSMNVDIDITDSTLPYKLKWCGVDFCDSTLILTKTFPIHHMQYIPATSSFTLLSDSTVTVSIDAFYIDSYEVNNELFQDPGSNPFNKWIAYPKTSLTFNEATSFCDNRSSSISINNVNVDGDNIGFKIPTLAQWEFAASLEFADTPQYENLIEYSTCEYPQPICNDDNIDCYYFNFQTPDSDCFGTLSLIGNYDGTNTSYEYSASASRIFDTSGNASEWVEWVNEDGESICAINGGSFSSQSTELKNSVTATIECSESHHTIGFRTILPAEIFLNEFKESISQ